MHQQPDPAELNQRHWDALADAHATVPNAYYDLDRLRAGGSSLSRAEEEGLQAAVGSVDGLDVLHLQCHLALDSVSLARRGARVTAVDFSPRALARAAEIARDCAADVRFVQADATRLPEELQASVDLVYATVGILNWIGDLERWMRSVRGVLRPGGRLLLVDVHPLYAMFSSVDPLVADFPYSARGALRFDDGGSYAGDQVSIDATPSVEHAHALADVVTACAAADLRIASMAEHLDCDFDPRGLLQPDEDGQYRLRVGGLPVPLLYTLVAARPAG